MRREQLTDLNVPTSKEQLQHMTLAEDSSVDALHLSTCVTDLGEKALHHMIIAPPSTPPSLLQSAVTKRQSVSLYGHSEYTGIESMLTAIRVVFQASTGRTVAQASHHHPRFARAPFTPFPFGIPAALQLRALLGRTQRPKCSLPWCNGTAEAAQREP